MLTKLEIVFLWILAFSELSATNQNDSFTCYENGCVCVPDSYDKLKVPSSNNNIIYLELNTYTDEMMTTLRKVDQKEFTLTLTFVWSISWKDDRLNITTKESPFVPIRSEVEKKLWTPFIEIFPVKRLKKLETMVGSHPKPGGFTMSGVAFAFFVLSFIDCFFAFQSCIYGKETVYMVMGNSTILKNWRENLL